MNATATIAPAGPQYMRALERANKVRLARAELKRRVATDEIDVAEVILDCPWEAESMAVGRPADEPAPLGSDPLPQVPRPDPDVREEDDRLDDRPPAAHARGDARVRWSGAALERDPLGNGQPDESVSCHQPASMPIRPSRGRTSQTPQPPCAEVADGQRGTNL